MEIIFTKHAEDRIGKRKITKDEIINTIKYPEKNVQKGRKVLCSKRYWTW